MNMNMNMGWFERLPLWAQLGLLSLVTVAVMGLGWLVSEMTGLGQ